MPASEPRRDAADGCGEELVRASAASAVRSGRTLVGPVDLAVRRGERIALLGPNGAGKTTLLRLLAGSERAASGRVELSGRRLARAAARQRARRVALATQQLPAATGWTVRELVLLGRTPHRGLGPASQADRAAVDEAIDAFGLAPFAERRVDTMSGGERRLAHLARVVAQGTPLLLLDEPLAHLDPANVALALDAVGRVVRSRDGAIIAALHEPSHALAWATRVVLLRAARIVADVPAPLVDDDHLTACYGTPLHVLRSPTTGAVAVATGTLVSSA